MAAKIKLTVSTNFDKAGQEFKRFGALTESESKRIDQALKKIGGDQLESFVQKNKRAALAVQATQGKVAALGVEARGLQRKMEMLIRNGMDPQDKAIQKMKNSYIQLQQAQENIVRQEQLLQGALQKTKQIALAVGAAFGAMAAFGTKAQFEYIKSLANVNTLLDMTNKEMENLDTTIQSMSVNFAIQKKELSSGVYQALSAGAVDLSEALNIVSKSAVLSKAGLIENAQAVDIITTAMNAYGKETVTAGHAADVYFQIIKKGKITGEELAGTIGQSITLFARANLGIEDLGAGVATLTKVGVKASEATTQLNAVVNAFIKPSKAMTQALNEANIASGSALLKQRGLAGAMKFLQDRTGGSNEELAKLLPNIRAMRGAMALSSEDGAVLNDVLADFANVSGVAQKAMDKQTNGFAKNAFTMEQAIVALQNLAMQIGKRVLPVLGKAAEFIVKFATDFDSLSTPVKLLVKLIPVLAASLAAMVVTLNFAAIITTATTAITALGGAFSALWAIMLANPAGAVIAAVAIAAAAANAATDVILGNMNKQSSAVGKWANRDAKATDMVIANMRRLAKLKLIPNINRKESHEIVRITKSLKELTGAKVKFDKQNARVKLVFRGGIEQTIASLNKEDEVREKLAHRKIENAKTEAKIAQDKQDQLEKNAVIAAKLVEAENKRLAELAAAQKMRLTQSRDLFASVQLQNILNTKNAQEQEIFLLEKKYKIERALLVDFYGTSSKIVQKLEQNKNKALKDINDKFLEDAKKHQDKLTKVEKKAVSDRMASLGDLITTNQVKTFQAQQQMEGVYSTHYDTLIKMAKVSGNDRIAFLEKEQDRILGIKGLSDEEYLAAMMAFEAKKIEIKKEAAEKARAIAQAEVDFQRLAANSIISIFGDIHKFSKIFSDQSVRDREAAHQKVMNIERQLEDASGAKKKMLLSELAAAKKLDNEKAALAEKEIARTRALALVQKGLAIALIAFETQKGAAAALNPLTNPFSTVFSRVAESAFIIAKGVTSAGVVAATPLPSAETGGRFEVPEIGMHRSDGAQMNVNPGETVEVTPRGESKKQPVIYKMMLNDRELWSSVQDGIDAQEITFTNSNLVQ